MNNKDILAKNLNHYLEIKDLSPTEFARKMDYPETTVFNWLHGKYYPRIDRIQQMADFFGIMKSDLTEDKSLPNDPNIIPLTPVKRIPILGEIACGEPILAQENFDGYFLADPTLVGGDFVLRCTGDSMIDANIFEDDLVFIRKTPDVENGSIAAVLIDDEATLKRVYKNDNEIILQPENRKYSPIRITEEDMKDIRILGQMTGVFSRRDR